MAIIPAARFGTSVLCCRLGRALPCLKCDACLLVYSFLSLTFFNVAQLTKSIFQVLTIIKDLRDKNQFVRKVAAGDLHAVIVTGSGTVWSWGHNSDGQLGLGDTIRRSVPHLITSLSPPIVAVAAAAGARHSLVLTSGGQVWAFGNNERGQLGLGDLSPRVTPTQIIGALASASITAITAGQYVPHFLSPWALPVSFIAGITAWH